IVSNISKKESRYINSSKHRILSASQDLTLRCICIRKLSPEDRMSELAVPTSMQYLDKAVGALRDAGVMPSKTDPAPINSLIEKISDLDPDKTQTIARTLGQASAFNEVVREQVSNMVIGKRYKEITAGFNSIRDDAKRMVDQLADNKIDLLERATNVWMK